RAFTIELPPFWDVGVAGVLLIAAIAAVLWAATHPSFRTASWQALLTDPIVGRAGRPIAIAGAAFIFLVVWRYVASVSRTPPTQAGPDDFSKAWTALEGAADAAPESILAFSGDFSFLFSDSGRSFIPYAAYGSSLFALGGPIGLADERRSLLAAFCEWADRDNLKPVIYAAPASLLPDLLDLGFKVEKIGENAVIDLVQFSLAGKARENIR
ncbi:MAG: phosphatidylglycerol lysyltransferase domain-containing protein, partial [Pseudomonadota bacterium]